MPSLSDFLDPKTTLDSIKSQLHSGAPLISLKGIVGLTKTQRAYSEALLLRDFEIEKDVQSWISSRTDLGTLFDRYQMYDPRIATREWPLHFPMRVLNGSGSISSADNIFMFFPKAVGAQSSNVEDYFGFEFIDIWANLMQQSVFACARRVFDLETQLQVQQSLRVSLEKTIFLASIFHEVGHRAGPWRVSPAADQRLQISEYHLDVLGELSTDSLLVSHLTEFPEIAQFVVLQRLFWFGRKGFKNNPLSSNTNHDNDCWIGAYLWQKLERAGLLFEKNQRLHLQFSGLADFFSEITREIDQLGELVLQSPAAQQDQLIQTWMREQVQYDSNLGFQLPQKMQQTFMKLQDIPEVPHFSPALSPSNI